MQIEAFLKEVVHESHSSRHEQQSDIVLLSSKPLTGEMRDLLSKPSYSRVVYLEGSPVLDVDLQRACLTQAATCFVLVDKNATDTVAADSVAILRYIAIRNVERAPRVLLQLHSPDLMEMAVTSGIERSDILCIEHIKMAILAKSSACPGFAALLSTLSCSAPTDDGAAMWLAEFQAGASQVSAGPSCAMGVPAPHDRRRRVAGRVCCASF